MGCMVMLSWNINERRRFKFRSGNCALVCSEGPSLIYNTDEEWPICGGMRKINYSTMYIDIKAPSRRGVFKKGLIGFLYNAR
jgi:hypothetical protein